MKNVIKVIACGLMIAFQSPVYASGGNPFGYCGVFEGIAECAKRAKSKCGIRYEVSPDSIHGFKHYALPGSEFPCMTEKGFSVSIQNTPNGEITCGITEYGKPALVDGDCTPRG